MRDWCFNGYNPVLGNPLLAECMGFTFENPEDKQRFTIDTIESLDRVLPINTICRRCNRIIGEPHPVEYEGEYGMILRKYFPGTAPLSTDMPLDRSIPRHIFYRGKLICALPHAEGGRWIHAYDDESYGVPDGYDLGNPMASPDFPRDCSQFQSPVLHDLKSDILASKVMEFGLGKRLVVPETAAVLETTCVDVVQCDEKNIEQVDCHVRVESDDVSAILNGVSINGDVLLTEELRVTEVCNDGKVHPLVCIAEVEEYDAINAVICCANQEDTVISINNGKSYVGGRDTEFTETETLQVICAGRAWIYTLGGHVRLPTFPMRLEVRPLTISGIFDGKSLFTVWCGTPFAYGGIDFDELMSRVAPDKRGKVLRSSVNSIQLLGKLTLDFFRAVSCLRGGMPVSQMQSAIDCDPDSQGFAFSVYAKRVGIDYGIGDYAMYKYYVGALMLTNPNVASLMASCIYPFGVQPKPLLLGENDRHMLRLSDGSCGEAVVRAFSLVCTKFLRMCVAYRFCYKTGGTVLTQDIDEYTKVNLCNEKLGASAIRGVGLTKITAERKRAGFMVEVFRGRRSLHEVASAFQILDSSFWSDIG